MALGSIKVHYKLTEYKSYYWYLISFWNLLPSHNFRYEMVDEVAFVYATALLLKYVKGNNRHQDNNPTNSV